MRRRVVVVVVDYRVFHETRKRYVRVSGWEMSLGRRTLPHVCLVIAGGCVSVGGVAKEKSAKTFRLAFGGVALMHLELERLIVFSVELVHSSFLFMYK